MQESDILFEVDSVALELCDQDVLLRLSAFVSGPVKWE